MDDEGEQMLGRYAVKIIVWNDSHKIDYYINNRYDNLKDFFQI